MADPVTEPDLDLPVAPGDVVAGKYVVERVLGAGGMGAVLVAHHRELGQRYALKVQQKSVTRSTDSAARFLQEARAASRLSSPHSVRVVDFGTLPDGSPFLAMEYLEGVDLAVHLSRSGGRLSVEETVRHILDVCDALAEAHALGIIHRDLKPSNLFLTLRPAGRPLVKVLDYGISKVLDPSISGANKALTRTHAVIGTPSYMAPEQWLASKRVDPRADIWSLGVCMYEMLAGRAPFEAQTPVELGAMLATHQPRAIRELRPDVPPALADAVHRCLAKVPEGRFESVGELAQVLEAVARMPAEPVVVPAPTSPSGAPHFTAPMMTDARAAARRESRPALTALAVIASLALAAATILGVSFFRMRARVESESAQRAARERAASVAPPYVVADVSSAAPVADVASSSPAADASAPAASAPAAPKRPPARSRAAPFPDER